MIEAEMVSETLGFYPQLTWLVTREEFIEFSRRESFKSCMIFTLFKDAISYSDVIMHRIMWKALLMARGLKAENYEFH
jgi:hypothetical protein